jgi:hypothetical protein
MTMLSLPEKRGNTELAYITDSERKLLRRRDAVKGKKAPEYSKEGVPVLEADLQSTGSTKHSRKHKYKKQYTDMASKKKDYSGYVDSHKDLSDAYDDIKNNPNSKQAKYWKPRMANMSKEAFGKAHAGEDRALKSGTYRGATAVKPKTHVIRAVPNKKKKTKPAKTTTSTTKTTVTQPSSGGGGGGGGSTSTLNIDPTQGGSAPIVAPLLDAVVVEGPESEIVQERIKDLINTNSPLFKAATTKALQSMNASGLVNSSIAQEAVMSSILAVAIPIAQADAATFTEQRMANQNASNAFKAQQNAAYYEAFVTRLNGQINETLRALSEKAANWRAVLNARAQIATQQGMSAEAAENALKTVTPTWF